MYGRVLWMFLPWRIPSSASKHRLKDASPSLLLVFITWLLAGAATFIPWLVALQTNFADVSSILLSWVFWVSFMCWYLIFAVSPAIGILKGSGLSYSIQIAAVLMGSILGSVTPEVIVSISGIFWAYAVMYTLWYVDKKNAKPCIE